MKYKNRIELRGNIGADPVLRTLPSGSRVATFSMATKQSWKSNGEWQSRDDWHYIEVWGNQVDEVMLYKKGQSVDVEGQSRTDRIVDKKSGEARYLSKVRAYSVVQIVRPARQVAGEDHDATGADDANIDDTDHAAWLSEFENAEYVSPRARFS